MYEQFFEFRFLLCEGAKVDASQRDWPSEFYFTTCSCHSTIDEYFCIAIRLGVGILEILILSFNYFEMNLINFAITSCYSGKMVHPSLYNQYRDKNYLNSQQSFLSCMVDGYGRMRFACLSYWDVAVLLLNSVPNFMSVYINCSNTRKLDFVASNSLIYRIDNLHCTYNSHFWIFDTQGMSIADDLNSMELCTMRFSFCHPSISSQFCLVRFSPKQNEFYASFLPNQSKQSDYWLCECSCRVFMCTGWEQSKTGY